MQDSAADTTADATDDTHMSQPADTGSVRALSHTPERVHTRPSDKGPYALTPNTVELIPTLGALFHTVELELPTRAVDTPTQPSTYHFNNRK